MRPEEIAALAVRMGAAEEDLEVLLPLCTAALTELEGRLRPGAVAADCGSALPVAAAWIAMDGLEGAGGRVESFVAGDLTVRTTGGVRSLRRRAEELMAPYLAERGFAFLGVKG